MIADAEGLDLLPDGVVIADDSGTVTLVNAAARQMLGEAATPGVSLEAAMVLQDQDGSHWFEQNQPYAGLAIRKALTEQSWLLPDGTEVLVNARLHRSRRGGPVEQVAAVIRSGRGRKVLDRERSDLVATVAHELRSPLTGVRGFVGTLLNRWTSLNDDQKHLMLRTVQSDAERLSRLITELLDVARIDTGRLPLYPRAVDASTLVRRVVDLASAGTTRTITLDAPEGLQVFADPDKFTQVITNLVDNGIRHGEGLITVGVQAISSPYDGVRVRIDDEGEGIAEEIRERVFTKFWKHGVRGGTGLGMYLVNGLVRVHGGDITISDAPDGGARIDVRWPSGDRRG